MEYWSPWATMNCTAAVVAVTVAVATILLLNYYVGHVYGRKKKYNLPPGPKPWPIIGNLNLMGALPHHALHELSKKYGPLMHLRFGSVPVVIGSSVELAKYFLKTNDVMFINRPKTAAGKYTNYNYSDISWSQYGAYWRQARKMCLVELFSAKRLASYEYIRVEEMKTFLRDVYGSSGKVVVLKDYMARLSLNVISRMVLGKKYLDKPTEGQAIVMPDEFKSMVEELFLLNGVINIGDSIPWLDFLDLQGYIARMKKLSKKFDRFLEHVLDEHNERQSREGDNFVPNDMVDVLLQQADDPTLEVKFERHHVKAVTQDLMAGGTESSTVTVEWAMSELMKKPDTIKKATEELDRVVGRERWVEESDIAKLPFIEAIVKETMRLHPVSPMLAPRLSREDTSVNGYDIPAGSLIMVHVWTIGRDPAIWDSPNEFMPERFLDKSIDVKGQDYELLPFGSGRRMCPGYNLGLKVVQVSLANLLHGFTWRLPDGTKVGDLNMDEIFGLSMPKKDPLHAIAEPRLLPHLYSA